MSDGNVDLSQAARAKEARDHAYSTPLEALHPGDPTLFRTDSHWPVLERLRKEDPVHYTPDSEYGPYWSITKYNDIMTVDTNHQVFSSEGGIGIASQDSNALGPLPMFIAMDPPKHDEQRKIVSVDFDVSSEGLVHLFGGKIINFRNGGVGFFDIRPKPGEDIGEDRLDENGIPKGRYEEICFLLEKLCLPPNSAMTDDLTPAESSFLKEKIYQTYQNVRNRIPIMDDFILSFENCRVSERPISQNLIDRLRKFAGAGFLGELLNREEEALQPDNSYTVFDFRFVQDNPQLALVATLMVKMFMRRFLAQEKNIKKYFDVDEVRVIAENPLLAALFSLIYSTARKRNCYCVAATQSPRHFLAENLRDLRDNMEVFWVLPVNDPELAQKAFKLSHGQRKLVEYISREGIGLNHRDLALFYPQGAAHLRFRLNPLDNRLLAQRGRQLLSEEETLDFIARVQQVETPSLTPAMVKDLKLD